MLLSSVILVLREILEAALIVSILLVFSRQLALSGRWIGTALVVGLLGATIYAARIGEVSDWFGYVGQEVVNATMQLILCGLVAAFIPLLYRQRRRALSWLMALVLVLSLTREGSEILIYYSGFLHQPELLAPVLLGGGLGTGIGLSAGALLYYGLMALRPLYRQRLSLVLLALFGGNMVSQATLLLIQADWLPAGGAVWDSSTYLPDQSVVGQLLYALVGYEATPSGLQAAGYLGATAVLLFLQWPFWRPSSEPRLSQALKP